MLAIYTHSASPLTKEFWKWVVRLAIGKYSGPNAVEDSLLRGLKILGVPFIRNIKPQATDTVLVLSGIEALKEAIVYKEKGTIKKLVAGPNVTAHPLDNDFIMANSAIDTIIVPAPWVADLWAHEAPVIASKLQVWAAGVPISQPTDRSGRPLVYDKMQNPDLVSEITNTIPNTQILRYGYYKREEYLAALSTAPYLIYLSESESQGLALQEAWAHDVPTFVYKNTKWGNEKLKWEHPQINCPYLTPELGTQFTTSSDLKLLVAQAYTIHPKEYCDTNLSDKVSAEKMLQILEEESNSNAVN